MPIGASKVGVLGAGLVPGGSVTFNASGTWAVPPGVKKVSITGKGGTGNPGVAGNSGNPGNPASGGSGGGGGRSGYGSNPCPGCYGGASSGGYAWGINGTQFLWFNPLPACAGIAGGAGGSAPGNPSPPTGFGQPGQTGQSGNAGTAGNPGTAGNTGQTSSALTKCFLGGAGGNAPPGGAAGNGGTGGQGGGGGNAANYNAGGNGGGAGNGAGTGGNGSYHLGNGWANSPGSFPNGPNSTQWGPPIRFLTVGGSGAGSVNSGQPGGSAPGFTWTLSPSVANQIDPANFPFGYNTPSPAGNTSIAMVRLGGQGTVVPITPIRAAPDLAPTSCVAAPPGVPNFMTGGFGTHTGVGTSAISFGFGLSSTMKNRCTLPAFNPTPERPTATRAGAGGGRGGVVTAQTNQPQTPNDSIRVGGAGGGGGRGNAGNAGGTSPTVSGSAATPVTYNCVPVTPGTPTPITVGAPGGQIVISWNPQ